MKMIGRMLVGASAGLLFSTFGLIDTTTGLELSGGNEWTLAIAVFGMCLGAFCMAAVEPFYRRIGSVIGAVSGLLIGILVRDGAATGAHVPGVGVPAGTFEPPRALDAGENVILLLALVLMGALIGTVIQAGWRRGHQDRVS